MIIKERVYRNNKYCLVETLDIINEDVGSAFKEVLKAYVEDLGKNALAAGASAITAGTSGDTIVDVIYAVKTTKDAYDIYQGIKLSKGIINDFLYQIDKVPLENNIDQIKNIAYESVIDISVTNEKLFSAISQTDTYDKISSGLYNFYDNERNILKQTVEEIKLQIIEYIKSIINSLGDWLGSFIPNDAGAGSAVLKGLLNDIVNNSIDKALTMFLDLLNKASAAFQDVILSESKLTRFLNNLVDDLDASIDDYLKLDNPEESLSIFSIKDNLRILADKSKYYGFLGGASPVYKAYQSAHKSIDFQKIKENIKSATALYSKIIKHLIAFFAITEGLHSGELQTKIETSVNKDKFKKTNAIKSKLNSQIEVGDLNFGKISDYIPDNISKSIEGLYEIKFLERNKNRKLLL